MRLNKLLFVLTSIGVLAVSSDSLVVAATATGNLPVSVVVGNNCTISTTAVAFPNYDPIVTHATAADDSTSGALIVTCTKGTVANIGLGLGANFTGTQRRMEDASALTNYLNYELYSNVGRTTVWGNAAGSWYTAAAAPDKNPRTFQVYGRILGGQDVPAGTYNDTVVATVNF
jgi:spore coat protein U-like protein